MFIFITPARWLGVLSSMLLLIASTTVQAQEIPIRFGKLDTKTATELIAHPSPDSAAAEVLCDFGESKIKGGQDGFELHFERTTRLLIRRRF